MTEEWSSNNQARTEPMPASPANGTPDAADGVAAESAGSAGASGSSGSGDSPDARGVPVPSDVPADGTSEGAEPVDGVRVTAIAPEGHADGETDNRMPPTTTF